MAGTGDSGEEKALRRRYQEDRASRHGRAAAGGGSSRPQASNLDYGSGEGDYTGTKVAIPSCRFPLTPHVNTCQFRENETVGPFSVHFGWWRDRDQTSCMFMFALLQTPILVREFV